MCNPSMNDEAAELYASQFKGSEIKIDRLGNTDRPVFEEESQEEIWEEVGKNRDFYGNAVWLKRVQEQFTIQRRP